MEKFEFDKWTERHTYWMRVVKSRCPEYHVNVTDTIAEFIASYGIGAAMELVLHGYRDEWILSTSKKPACLRAFLQRSA